MARQALAFAAGVLVAALGVWFYATAPGDGAFFLRQVQVGHERAGGRHCLNLLHRCEPWPTDVTVRVECRLGDGTTRDAEAHWDEWPAFTQKTLGVEAGGGAIQDGWLRVRFTLGGRRYAAAVPFSLTKPP